MRYDHLKFSIVFNKPKHSSTTGPSKNKPQLDYSDPYVIAEVQRLVDAKLRGEIPETNPTIVIPVRTLRRYVQKRRLELEKEGLETAVTGKKTALITEEQREILCTAIINRDSRNDGMSRKEILSWILVLSNAKSLKQCENHWD